MGQCEIMGSIVELKSETGQRYIKMRSESPCKPVTLLT